MLARVIVATGTATITLRAAGIADVEARIAFDQAYQFRQRIQGRRRRGRAMRVRTQSHGPAVPTEVGLQNVAGASRPRARDQVRPPSPADADEVRRFAVVPSWVS